MPAGVVTEGLYGQDDAGNTGFLTKGELKYFHLQLKIFNSISSRRIGVRPLFTQELKTCTNKGKMLNSAQL